MNYILLNNNKQWTEVINSVFKNFMKEVDIDGEDRIDCIFGTINCGIFSKEYFDDTRRNQFSKIKEFFNIGGGAIFGLFILEEFQDLLYSEYDIQSKLSWFFDERGYTFEIRSSCLQEFGLNTTNFKYYILIYKKQKDILFIFNDNQYLSFKKNKIDNEKPMEDYIPNDLLIYILEKIKENLI